MKYCCQFLSYTCQKFFCHTHTDRLTDKHTEKHTDRLTDIHTEKHADRLTDRHIENTQADIFQKYSDRVHNIPKRVNSSKTRNLKCARNQNFLLFM